MSKAEDLKKHAKARLMERREISGDCWLYTGILKKGYGRMGYRGRMVAAHRVAYEILKGPIPVGLYVCHKCDVRNCFNPDHLFLGTHQDNMADMVSKGRHYTRNLAKARAIRTAAEEILQRSRALIDELSEKHGLSPARVRRIALGGAWKTKDEAA
jgi:hypothetical protein